VIAAPEMVPPLPEPTPGTTPRTLRERVSEHTAAPYCQSCHVYMNPLGFPFERYDGIGRFRLREGDVEIDPSGEIVPAGETEGVAVADAIELAHTLAVDPQVEDCFLRSLFQYAYGRPPDAGDACELERLSTRFRETDGNVVELVSELVGSTHFTRRRAP
jgi:hypothetical protein